MIRPQTESLLQTQNNQRIQQLHHRKIRARMVLAPADRVAPKQRQHSRERIKGTPDLPALVCPMRVRTHQMIPREAGPQNQMTISLATKHLTLMATAGQIHQPALSKKTRLRQTAR